MAISNAVLGDCCDCRTGAFVWSEQDEVDGAQFKTLLRMQEAWLSILLSAQSELLFIGVIVSAAVFILIKKENNDVNNMNNCHSTE